MARWANPAAEVEPVLGYKLMMTDEFENLSTVIYDNPTNPNV